jgi:hypothetical protein
VAGPTNKQDGIIYFSAAPKDRKLLFDNKYRPKGSIFCQGIRMLSPRISFGPNKEKYYMGQRNLIIIMLLGTLALRIQTLISLEEFIYDPERDVFICPEGKELRQSFL